MGVGGCGGVGVWECGGISARAESGAAASPPSTATSTATAPTRVQVRQPIIFWLSLPLPSLDPGRVTGAVIKRRLALAVDTDEVGDRAIVGALRLWWEEATWQLAHPPVIADAFAALALLRARLIRAGALRDVFFYLALHVLTPPVRNRSGAKHFPEPHGTCRKGQRSTCPAPDLTDISGQVYHGACQSKRPPVAFSGSPVRLRQSR